MSNERPSFGKMSPAEAREELDRKALVMWRAVYQHPSGVHLWDRASWINFQERGKVLLGDRRLLSTPSSTIDERAKEICKLLSSSGPSKVRGKPPSEIRESYWSDPAFQNTQISNPDFLAAYLQLGPDQTDALRRHNEVYHLSVNPHYLSLIDPEDPNDPIRKVFLPYDIGIPTELGKEHIVDPSGESRASNISPHTTQRYPWVLKVDVNTPGVCPAGCSYCQRTYDTLSPEILSQTADASAVSRQVNLTSANRPGVVDQIVEEIAQRPYIQDVLLTGGDFLRLPIKTRLDLLRKIFQLPAFREKGTGTVRGGTKLVPVNPWLCQEDEFLDGLAKITEEHPHQLYMVTHVVHPMEITPPVADAVLALKKAGVASVVNQAVFLKGVNDDIFTDEQGNQFPGTFGQLMLAAKSAGIDPYRIFLPKEAAYSDPYSPGLNRAYEIYRLVQNHLPGPYLPLPVISAPDNGGKIPVLPNTLVSEREGRAVLRTSSGGTAEYPL